ncbi:hypothetical protein C9374_002765 [Naegleria lovaniensis]|uniref:Uncharacterized protein n=1 Tax=Naegleria lovaniensis TaxID=51637 RepID=A0AA88KLY3_NAELO|nr:uncharacterized protein C9374_002765 [Naegleria lovaniensis]KAG2386319.1 hypothetical protein C9374_002765 [Naegleria lovaniensis]
MRITTILLFLVPFLSALIALVHSLYVVIPDNTAVLPVNQVIPLLFIGGGVLSGQNATLTLYRQRQTQPDEMIMQTEVHLPAASGYVPWVIPTNATASCSYYVCLNPVNSSLIASSNVDFNDAYRCYAVGGFYCAFNPSTVNTNGPPRRPYVTLDYPQQYTKWLSNRNYSVVYSQFFGNGVQNGAQGSFSLALSLWRNNGAQGKDVMIDGTKKTYTLDKSKPNGEVDFFVPSITTPAVDNRYYICAELVSNEVGVDALNNQTNRDDEGNCFAKSGMFSISDGYFTINAPLANAKWQFNTTEFLDFNETMKFDQFSLSVFQIRETNKEFISDDVRLINVNQQVPTPRQGKIPFIVMWGGALRTTPGCNYFICVNPVFVGPYNVRCLVKSEVFCIEGGQAQPLPVPQQQQQPPQGPPPQQQGQQQGPPPQQQGAPQQPAPQQQKRALQHTEAATTYSNNGAEELASSLPDYSQMRTHVPVAQRVNVYGQHSPQMYPHYSHGYHVRRAVLNHAPYRAPHPHSLNMRVLRRF